MSNRDPSNIHRRFLICGDVTRQFQRHVKQTRWNKESFEKDDRWNFARIFSLSFFFWTRLFSQSWLNEAGERNSNFGQWFWTAIPNPVSRRPAAEANTLSTRIFRLVESFCTPNWPGRTFINLNLNRLFGGCPLVDKRRYYFREERTFPSARVTSDRDRRPIEFLLVVRFPHERQSPRNVEYLAQRQFDAIEFLGSTLIKSFN